MGMVMVFTGLVVGLILGIIGAIVGGRLAKGSGWKFVAALLGFVVGAVLGFAAGFGGTWALYAEQLP